MNPSDAGVVRRLRRRSWTPCRLAVGAAALASVLLGPSPARLAPGGHMSWGVHVSLAPTWFDPAEATGTILPFMLYYALHDAVVKPMPGRPIAPSLAESWTVSRDGLRWEFIIRKNARFHNGDPVTAEDVKFSFERYKGAGANILKDKVAVVEIVDPWRVRFRLRESWADFLTFYGTPATAAAWVVPRKYVERVGDEGFKRMPVGAGPYRFVSFKPGVELTLEAFDGYWRKEAAIKTLVFRVIPDEATRLVSLKRGEVDIAYAIRGPLAEELRRTPGITLKSTDTSLTLWYVFTEQWDTKSPWHDRRVRLAANLAIDRQAINQAETLGYSRVTCSIIPQEFEYFWRPPSCLYDPAKARQLLASAGYPAGFDAGTIWSDNVYATLTEAVGNYWGAVGIRTRVRTLERAGYLKALAEKKLTHVVLSGSAALGNTASRIETFVATGGLYSYGSYPEIDKLYREQANELDRTRREAALHKIQQLIHNEFMYAPLMAPRSLTGVGARIAEPGLGLIDGLFYSAPYEDLMLKLR
jgi:peptide/nickel transport system substrate-binding protein